MIKSKQEVENFLRTFKPKLDVWGIFFLDRQKNKEALLELGITPQAREEIVRNIEENDYVETIVDELSFGDMWVFGKDHDESVLYIKISLGKSNTKTICISFHVAEHPLRYAFK